MSTDPDTVAVTEGEGVHIPGEERPEVTRLSEVEQIASEKGWKPKDAYEGPEHLWRPADEFLRKMPASRDLKRDIKSLKDQIDRMASASSRTTERALREQAEAINARFATAVENKDAPGAAAAAKEMRELEAETARSQPSTGDVEKDFARDNPWYGKNDEATAHAISVSQRLHAQGKSVEDQLEAAAESVRKRFPELFEQRQERKPATVAAPSRANGAKREKGYADLPAEAKRAADDYAELFKSRHGKDPDESKKAYAKDYFANVGEAA